ncbi:unnamed protein product, partial [marine sediment metagenome]
QIYPRKLGESSVNGGVQQEILFIGILNLTVLPLWKILLETGKYNGHK